MLSGGEVDGGPSLLVLSAELDDGAIDFLWKISRGNQRVQLDFLSPNLFFFFFFPRTQVSLNVVVFLFRDRCAFRIYVPYSFGTFRRLFERRISLRIESDTL